MIDFFCIFNHFCRLIIIVQLFYCRRLFCRTYNHRFVFYTIRRQCTSARTHRSFLLTSGERNFCSLLSLIIIIQANQNKIKTKSHTKSRYDRFSDSINISKNIKATVDRCQRATTISFFLVKSNKQRPLSVN